MERAIGVFMSGVLALAVAGCDEGEDDHREVVGDRAIDIDACPSACETVAGDVNGDGSADITDFINLVNHYNYGDPVCELAADVNGDSDVDISDLIYFSQWMWSGGDDPVPAVAPGDVNADGAVDITDMQLLPRYLFGPQPSVEICEPATDVTGDCQSDVSDVQRLTAYLFGGGAELEGCSE